MPDEDSENKTGTSGATEKFWDKNYKSDRYRNPDGTVVPLYDQILIEENCRMERFDPLDDAIKRSERGSTISRPPKKV